MTSTPERATRLAAWTLLAAAVAIPALLVRGWIEARMTRERAEALRRDLMVAEVRAGEPKPSFDETDPEARVGTALAPAKSGSPSDSVRFFSRDEIEQDPNAAAPGAAPRGTLLPPVGLEAVPTVSARPASAPSEPGAPNLGVLVTWQDNPDVHPGSVLRSQVYRWQDRERPTPVHLTAEEAAGSAAGGPRRHEFLDTTVCQGTRVSYSVRAIQLDRVEGVEVRRSALSRSVSLEVPVVFELEVLGLESRDEAEASGLPLESPTSEAIRLAASDLRTSPATRHEFRVVIPEDVGRDVGLRELGHEVGWVLAAVDRETRTVTIPVAVPVFNADGSRKLEANLPVNLQQTVTRAKQYPVLRLRDRCGNERILRAALEKTPSPAGVGVPASR